MGEAEALACGVQAAAAWTLRPGRFAHGCSPLPVSLDREAGVVRVARSRKNKHESVFMKACLWNTLLTCCFRQRAARDYDFAVVLLQVLLENLDIQHSRFVQEESFLLQHNIRRYKQNFQVCKTKAQPCDIFLVRDKQEVYLINTCCTDQDSF